jgi:thioredoxin 1
MSGGDSIVYVKSVEDWNTLAKEHESTKSVLVANFSAAWCGPCKALYPKLVAFAQECVEKNMNVQVAKIDIDECEKIADKFSVASIPTTLLILDCEEQKRIVGADINGIKIGVESLLSGF